MAAIAAGVVMVVLAVPEVQPRPDPISPATLPDPIPPAARPSLVRSRLQPDLPRSAFAPPCRRTCNSAWLPRLVTTWLLHLVTAATVLTLCLLWPSQVQLDLTAALSTILPTTATILTCICACRSMCMCMRLLGAARPDSGRHVGVRAARPALLGIPTLPTHGARALH